MSTTRDLIIDVDAPESTTTTTTSTSTNNVDSTHIESPGNIIPVKLPIKFGFLSPDGHKPLKLNEEESNKLIAFFKIAKNNTDFYQFLRDSFLMLGEKTSKFIGLNDQFTNFKSALNLNDLARCITYCKRTKPEFLKQDDAKLLLDELEDKFTRYLNQYNTYVKAIEKDMFFSEKEYTYINVYKEIERLRKILHEDTLLALANKLERIANNDPELKDTLQKYLKFRKMLDDKDATSKLAFMGPPKNKIVTDFIPKHITARTISIEETVKTRKSQKRSLNNNIDNSIKSKKSKVEAETKQVAVETETSQQTAKPTISPSLIETSNHFSPLQTLSDNAIEKSSKSTIFLKTLTLVESILQEYRQSGATSRNEKLLLIESLIDSASMLKEQAPDTETVKNAIDLLNTLVIDHKQLLLQNNPVDEKGNQNFMRSMQNSLAILRRLYPHTVADSGLTLQFQTTPASPSQRFYSRAVSTNLKL